MPDGPRSPGGCPLPLKVETKEEELASEGSDSIDARGEGWGSVAARCPMYKGILSKGALGSKNGLRTGTTNGC